MTVAMYGIGLLLSILARKRPFFCLSAPTQLSLMELSDKTRQKRGEGVRGMLPQTKGIIVRWFWYHFAFDPDN